jgi:hypothetical protein
MSSSIRRGKNFSSAQVDRLLACVQEILPNGAMRWEKVAEIYNTDLPAGFEEREAESLRRKFKKLKSNPKPTGNTSRNFENIT